MPQPEIKKLVRELDRLFSLYVRQKAEGDENGYVRCYTCGGGNTWRYLHCGHYIGRQYLATRWNKDNARVQCARCNSFNEGEKVKFRENLIKEIGIERVESLEMMKHNKFKKDKFILQELIRIQKAKLIEQNFLIK